MRHAAIALAVTLAACAGAPEERAPQGDVIDLSWAFDERTVYWPTAEGFVLERGPEGVTERGYWYAAHSFRSAEHGGTHLDAPYHFGRGRRTVDEIPLDHLVGPGVVVDVSPACEVNRDYLVTVGDFESFERAHGRIPDGAIVLVRTGYARHWPDRRLYLGTDERGEDAVAKLHFPGLHPDAARWLVEQRSIRAVGIDTASIDFGQSTDFESHVVLAEAQVPALENVARLDLLPATGFAIAALPMKIRGGTGAPVRIAAIVP